MSESGLRQDEAERIALAERILGVSFTDKELIRTALTHPSHLVMTEHDHEHYERLEFLGDSVLGFLMSEHLYREHPDLPEGRMTKIRSSFVSGKALARTAEEAGLAEALIVGPGAEPVRAAHTRSLLADSFEAILAAVYLDKGMDAVSDLFFRMVDPATIVAAIADADEDDPKNLLQEMTQAKDGTLPTYEIVEVSGPPHDRSFTAEVTVFSRVVGRGSGPSKKDAQREAAEDALGTLEERA